MEKEDLETANRTGISVGINQGYTRKLLETGSKIWHPGPVSSGWIRPPEERGGRYRVSYQEG